MLQLYLFLGFSVKLSTRIMLLERNEKWYNRNSKKTLTTIYMTWRKTSILAILIFAGVFIANASPAEAATKYFNFGGSNTTQSGTEANPYTTLSQWTANMNAGDTAYVTGTLSSSWTINLVGTVSAPTTIARWSGQPTLSVSVSGGSGIAISSAQYVNLSGVSTTSSAAYGLYLLNSSNITLSTITATSSAGSAVFISNGDNVTISALTVSSSAGTGVVITEGSTNGTISNSTVSNTGSNAYGVFIGKEFSSTTGSNTGWTFDDVDITTTGNAGFDCSSASNSLTLKNSTITGATGSSGYGINITQCDTVTLTNNITHTNAKSGVNIQTVSNLSMSGSTSYSNTQSGFSLMTITTGTVSSNTAYSNTENGIALSGTGSSNVTISGNTAYSNTQNGITATAQGTGLTVNGNKSYGHTSSSQSSGFGFSIASTAPTVTNNISYGNRIGMIVAATSASVANPTIRNNTIYNSSSAAITFVETSPNTITGVTMQNNTFTTATNGQVISYAGGDGPTWTSSDYNNFQLVGSSANITTGVTTLEAWRTTSSQDANSLSVDPLFTSTTSGSENFALQITSTLIDAGNPSSTTPTTDYAGVTRPHGASGRIDIGAYEKQTPDATNVTMTATASYSATTGNTVTLTITDATNPATTTYAVTTDNGTTWLTAAGDTSATPVYSTSKTWTHTNLTGGTAYSYKLRIADSDQSTYLALGDAVSATTFAQAPATLTAPDVTSGTLTAFSATVSWAEVSGATGYVVSYGTDTVATNLGTFTVNTSGEVVSSSTVSTTLSNLLPSTIYYWKVASVTSLGTGAYSSVATFTTSVANLGLLVIPDAEQKTNIRVVDTSGTQSASFFAYGTAMNLKVDALTADLNDDGVLEIITTVLGPSNAVAHIRIFDSSGTFIVNLFPFGGSVRGGASIAAGDFNNDGVTDLAVVPYGNVASNTRTYDFSASLTSPTVLAWKFTYGASLKSGSLLAAGDVTGDGVDDLVVWNRDRNPNVQVLTFNDTTNVLDQVAYVFPYGEMGINMGADLVLADIDGDEDKDIVTVPTGGRAIANIQVYAYTTASNGLQTGVRRNMKRLTWIQAYQEQTAGTFNLAAGDINNDGNDEIVIAPYAGLGGQVMTYDYYNNQLNLIASNFPYGKDYARGVHVALADFDSDQKAELVTSTQNGNAPNTRVYSYGSTGWTLDDWFMAFSASARFGTRVGR